MQKLWQKNWQLNTIVETFETQGDLVLDQKLVEFDCLGSSAHAQGLQKAGLLSESETQLLIHGLQTIKKINSEGQFLLQFGDEDVHTKIENYLTEHYGEVGKKIHTGRSRNDQVLTAIRLFTKKNLLQIWHETLELITQFQTLAENQIATLMPGYTHMQKAMPSTVGMWAGSFAEGLLDHLTQLKGAFELNNQCPLGSAAGYGVPLPLDRQYVSDKLGFAKVQHNFLYCQNSRGQIEGAVIASLISLLQVINKCATDILLFTTTEFNFFEIAPELCSGSSIMPQKKNVDVAELLRSKVHLVLGNYTQVISLSANLTSGYNRDLQDSKKPLFESLELTLQCLHITNLLITSLTVKKEALQTAMTPELFATHYALDLVKHGVSFRDAYQQAVQKYSDCNVSVLSKAVTAQLSSASALALKVTRGKLTKEQAQYQLENQKYQTIVNDFLSQKGKNEN